MVAFNGGVTENVHVRGKKLRHLRIKAGPQRDRYVHDIVFEAKILGRREAWEWIMKSVPESARAWNEYADRVMAKHGAIATGGSGAPTVPPVPPVPNDDFFRYLDTSYETVDHHDDDSLNNDPANLVRMNRGENTAKANRRRAKGKQSISKSTSFDPETF